MANEQNLRTPTTEEAREIGRKGGIASGEARRRKRTMKKTIEMLAALPFDITTKDGKSLKEQLKILGINEDDIDYEMAMNYSVLLTAIKGGKNQVSAATFIRDTLGEKPAEKVELSNDVDKVINEVDDYLCKKKKN